MTTALRKSFTGKQESHQLLNLGNRWRRIELHFQHRRRFRRFGAARGTQQSFLP
jgi:hypothetical protein